MTDPQDTSTPGFSENEVLKEAENRLANRDYLGALAILESAWRMLPNSPQIQDMQERIQAARQLDLSQRHDSRLDEARRLLSQGNEERAFFIAEEILAENSAHKDAKNLREHILEVRWQQVQSQITAGLELAIQPLTFFDFEVASKLLVQLQSELQIDSCRKEIERIRAGIAALHAAFEAREYFEVSSIVKQLLSRDPFGWIEPHEQVFTAIHQEAASRFEEQQDVIRDALQEARQLFHEGSLQTALSKLDQLAGHNRILEARELRDEILTAYRDQKSDEAQEFAAQLEWEKAIHCWKQILHFFPEAMDIRELLSRAEEHVTREYDVHKKLLRMLKDCYVLMLKEDWTEAHESTEAMLQSIEPGFRLVEIEQEIKRLQSEILKKNRTDQQQAELLLDRLSESNKLYKQGSYNEALQIVSTILDTGFLQEEALELKIAIEKAIHSQTIASRFQSAVQKGKEYFEQRDWNRAIEVWKKASLLSNEPYIAEWISQAEERWKKERHVRLSILAMLAEADELMFYGKLEQAREKVEKCRAALSGEFSFEDLIHQANQLAQKLSSLTEKEEAVRQQVQVQLEEATLLYGQRQYSQALKKVEAVLSQYPELEAALQLKSQFENAEAANASVLEMLKAVMKLVLKRDTRRLPALLRRLKDIAVGTSYAEDCQSIIDELPMIVLEIESDDRTAIHERLDHLFQRSLLALEYEQPLRAFIASLEDRSRKELALQTALQQGLTSLETGDRPGAMECLDRFHQIVHGKRTSLDSPLDRTATFTDEDLKLTERELETLQSLLLRHEIETILVAAQKVLLNGDKQRAEDLVLKALELDPENSAARDALRELQME